MAKNETLREYLGRQHYIEELRPDGLLDAENIREDDDENRCLVSVLFNGGHSTWIITCLWAERPFSDNPIYDGSAYWPVTGHSEERFGNWEDFKSRLDELAAMLDYVILA